MGSEQKRQNLRLAYNDTGVVIATIIAASLIILLQFLFTDFQTLTGNLGPAYAAVEVITGAILALLFGSNVGLLYYKLKLANSVKKKHGATTLLGGMLGVLVTGCPACSITIASYLGLAGILSALPFHGIEIKMLGILLLVYSTNDLLKNLTVCVSKK